MLDQIGKKEVISIARSYVISSLMTDSKDLLSYNKKLLPDFIEFLVHAGILTNEFLNEMKYVTSLPENLNIAKFEWYYYFVSHVKLISKYFTNDIATMLLNQDYAEIRSAQIFQWLMLPIFEENYKTPLMLQLITAKAISARNQQLLRWILDFFATPIGQRLGKSDKLSVQKTTLTEEFIWKIVFNATMQPQNQAKLVEEFLKNGYFVDISTHDYMIVNSCFNNDRIDLLKIFLNPSYIKELKLSVPTKFDNMLHQKYLRSIKTVKTQHENLQDLMTSSSQVSKLLPAKKKLLEYADRFLEFCEVIIIHSPGHPMNFEKFLEFYNIYGASLRFKPLPATETAVKKEKRNLDDINNGIINRLMDLVQCNHSKVIQALMTPQLMKKDMLFRIYERKNLSLFQFVVESEYLKSIRSLNSNIIAQIYAARKQEILLRKEMELKSKKRIEEKPENSLNPWPYLSIIFKRTPFKLLNYQLENGDYSVVVDAIKLEDRRFLESYFNLETIQYSSVRKAWNNPFVLDAISNSPTQLIEWLSMLRAEATRLEEERLRFQIEERKNIEANLRKIDPSRIIDKHRQLKLKLK